MYPKAYPGAKWMEKKSQWTFSGARIWMTRTLSRTKTFCATKVRHYLHWHRRINTVLDTVCLGLFTPRLRTADPRSRIYASDTNPRVSHACQMFIDPSSGSPSGRRYYNGRYTCYQERHGEAGEPLFLRRFIPASLIDNPYSTSREIRSCCLRQRFNASNCLKAHGIQPKRDLL